MYISEMCHGWVKGQCIVYFTYQEHRQGLVPSCQRPATLTWEQTPEPQAVTSANSTRLGSVSVGLQTHHVCSVKHTP